MIHVTEHNLVGGGGRRRRFGALRGEASAPIACSGNTCWHAHEVYHYPPSANVIVHEDTWHAGPTVVWREHDGRGYWVGDHWTTW